MVRKPSVLGDMVGKYSLVENSRVQGGGLELQMRLMPMIPLKLLPQIAMDTSSSRLLLDLSLKTSWVGRICMGNGGMVCCCLKRGGGCQKSGIKPF